MASTLTVLVICLISLCFWIIAEFFWDVLHSPLNAAKDAHWSVKFCGAWIRWQRIYERDAQAVHEAHVRLGPVVRLGPKELSVNDVDGGLKPIYDGRLPKTDFYDVASSYGELPMVALRDEKPHQQRKRLVAKPYGKSTLMQSHEWQAQQSSLADDLVRGLGKLLETGSELDLYDVFFAWSLAAISAYIFGRTGCLNLLDDIPEASRVREQYFSQRTPQFISAVLPIPSALRHWTGTEEEIRWIWQLQDQAEKALGYVSPQEGWQTIYGFMKKSFRPLRSKQSDPDTPLTAKEAAILSSEMQDHMIAGIDTSTSALTACSWLLSLKYNQHWQDRLREEIRQVPSSIHTSQLEHLPILNAVIMETLRLFPPVAGGQPRVTDKSIVVGPRDNEVNVPPGVKIHCQAQSLHRSSIFEDPENFRPERWLDSSPEKRKDMDRWFWAFGSGTRRCIGAFHMKLTLCFCRAFANSCLIVGEYLGLSNIRLAMATIWGQFQTQEGPTTRLKMSQGIVSMPIPTEGSFIRLHVERVGSR
jgi:hypothetical protein